MKKVKRVKNDYIEAQSTQRQCSKPTRSKQADKFR